MLRQVFRVVLTRCKLPWPCLCLASPFIEFPNWVFLLLQTVAGKLTDLRFTYFLKRPFPHQSHVLLCLFFLSPSGKFPAKRTLNLYWHSWEAGGHSEYSPYLSLCSHLRPRYMVRKIIILAAYIPVSLPPVSHILSYVQSGPINKRSEQTKCPVIHSRSKHLLKKWSER